MNEIINKKLYTMILNNNITQLREFLNLESAYNIENSVITKNGDSILHVAVSLEQLDIVKLLLVAHGVNTNKGNSFGCTPLFDSTNLEITKLLLDAGANVNQHDNKGNIPLHTIIQFGSMQLINLHLQRGAHPLSFNGKNQTPTLEACKLASSKIVRHLVKNGGDLQYCNSDGHNGFHLACIHNRLAVIKYLVTHTPHDIDINERDTSLRTPLYFAVLLKRYEICKILLNHKVELEIYDDAGLKPLHLALINHDIPIITLLLNHGALLENENMRVQQFLFEIEQFPQQFILLISFHIFIDNHEMIKKILIENDCRRTFSMYLQALNGMYCTMIVKGGSAKGANSIKKFTIKFPHILKNKSTELAYVFLDETCRDIIHQEIVYTQCKKDIPLSLVDFLLTKYNNGNRTLAYMLIKKKHIKETAISKLRISTFTTILDYLNLNDLKNILNAFRICGEC